MKTVKNQNFLRLTPSAAWNSQPYPSLETVIRPTIQTKEAAYYLNRRPQTLRAWACMESGPIRPIRINGRLAWKVTEIKQVLGMEG